MRNLNKYITNTYRHTHITKHNNTQHQQYDDDNNKSVHIKQINNQLVKMFNVWSNKHEIKHHPHPQNNNNKQKQNKQNKTNTQTPTTTHKQSNIKQLQQYDYTNANRNKTRQQIKYAHK